MCSYAANAWVLRKDPSLATSFGDGLSNTIVLAERYAYCGGHFSHWVSTNAARRPTFADGSNGGWASCGDVYPETSGSPPVSRAGNGEGTFQVRPLKTECNPRLATTPHRSGMLAALADGSVRTLAPGMAETTYWAAVTGNGGEVLGPDW